MTASPFGRYAGPAGGLPVHRVQLLRLPVRLLVDGRDRHDSLLRECALLATAGAPSLSPRLAALTQVLGVRYGAAAHRPDEGVDGAVRQGQPTVDLTYDVPAGVLDAVARLEALMAEADELCRSEQLLTLPRTPLQLRFDTWYCGQFRRQVGGGPPTPWDGPLQP